MKGTRKTNPWTWVRGKTGYALAGFGLVLVFGALFYHLLVGTIFEELRQRAILLAESYAQEVDADLHETLVDPSQEDSDAYAEAVAPLKAADEAFPYVDSVYTLRKTDEPGILAFVLDTYEGIDENGDGIVSEDEEKAHLGEPYDARRFPEMIRGFEGPTADRTVTSDKWGHWISGYAPILNAEGEAVALLGVDIDAEYYWKARKRFMTLFLPAYAAVVLATGFAAWRFGRDRKRD